MNFYSKILAAILFAAIPIDAHSQSTSNGKVTTAAPTYNNNTAAPLSLDTTGNLRINCATGCSGSGNSNAQATTLPPTYTNGTSNPISQDLSGNLRMTLTTALPNGANVLGSIFTRQGMSNTPIDGNTNAGLAVNQVDNAGISRVGFSVMPLDFNGTTWDRKRGDVNGSWTQGNVASGTADAGFPVKIGGVFNTTPPTISTGQRADLQLDSSGNLRSQIVGYGATLTDGAINTGGFATSKTSPSTPYSLPVYNAYFNGTTWDRARGTVNGANIIPATNSETLPFSAIMAATTNSTNVKNAPGIITEISVYNTSATFAWLKLYNAAAAPTCGTGTPVGRYLIPASSSGAGSNVTIGLGKFFSTGISYCVTGLVADADTTATAANTMTVNLTYK